MQARCRICTANTTFVANIDGRYSKRKFELRRCSTCGFAFIADPWLDFAKIYDDDYYSGRGVDPLANYAMEATDPHGVIRIYEWEGICRIVKDIGPTSSTRDVSWLDYGAGSGGLVRYAREQHGYDISGFEPSAFAARMADASDVFVPDRDLESLAGRFEIVTAIEVFEHTLDPVAELRRIRSLLKPGGVLMLTTGNAAPYANRLQSWRYVIPEIHISFFEPRTLDFAMRQAGFSPEHIDCGRGWDLVMKYKVLKNLHAKRRSLLTDLIPARPLSLLGERMTRLGDQPIGRAV
jgi:SAM-dependent methyltransferase